MYTIIQKIECVEGAVVRSTLGYTTDCSNVACTKADYDSFRSWVSDNEAALKAQTVDISDFFDTTPVVYNCNWTTRLMGKCCIHEVVDFSFLEA